MKKGIPGKRRRCRPTRKWMGNPREDKRDFGVEEEDTGDRGKLRQAIHCGGLLDIEATERISGRITIKIIIRRLLTYIFKCVLGF